ncbi:unnamed protein product, partial [Rotaria magnacalcarata]
KLEAEKEDEEFQVAKQFWRKYFLHNWSRTIPLDGGIRYPTFPNENGSAVKLQLELNKILESKCYCF